MTVKELKKELEKYPDSMEVFLDERQTEFTFGLLNSLSIKTVHFSEDVDEEVLAEDDYLILSEQ